MKHNKKNIMNTAWALVRSEKAQNISDALRKSWSNSKAVMALATMAGSEIHTYTGWKDLGREVTHGEKCGLKVTTFDAYTKSGTRVLCYFTEEQTCPLGSQD